MFENYYFLINFYTNDSDCGKDTVIEWSSYLWKHKNN